MNDLKNRKTKPTKTSVLRQLATLQSMSLEQLREKWLDLYGTEPPQYKKQFLVKRLAHRIQELFYGGLSEQAKSHLKKVAETDLYWEELRMKYRNGGNERRIMNKVRDWLRFVRNRLRWI